MSALLTRAEATALLSSITAIQFIGIEGFQPFPDGKLGADVSYLYNEDVSLAEGSEIKSVYDRASDSAEGRLSVARWLVLRAPADYLFDIVMATEDQ